MRLQLTPRWSGHGHGHRPDRRYPGHADHRHRQGLRRRRAPGLGDHPDAGHRHRSRAWPAREAERERRSRDRHARRPSQTVGQQLSFPRRRRALRYTVSKYVGVSTSPSAASAAAPAQRQAARRRGGRVRRHAAARTTRRGQALWAGRIDVLGDPALATDVNASEFYLWSSTRAGVDWSISPAGLSSNGYNGHVFWDAETWMYPSLLAQHPDLAAGMNNYRFDRLGGRAGARRGDRLRRRALPVGERARRHRADPAAGVGQQRGPLRAAHHRRRGAGAVAVLPGHRRPGLARRPRLAGIVAGSPVLGRPGDAGAGGSYHINGVTGPDEENPNVNDEAYTNVAAARHCEPPPRQPT